MLIRLCTQNIKRSLQNARLQTVGLLPIRIKFYRLPEKKNNLEVKTEREREREREREKTYFSKRANFVWGLYATM
jgi:hypothetical protein